MTFEEFKRMILEDEEDPLTVDGFTFRTIKERDAYIRHLYVLWKEGN